MIGSVSNGNAATGLLSAVMKEKSNRQDLEVAVLKKGQEIQKMQGDAALKLIDSAGGASSAKVDVRV